MLKPSRGGMYAQFDGNSHQHYYKNIIYYINMQLATEKRSIRTAFRGLNIRGTFRGCSVPFRGLNTTVYNIYALSMELSKL